MADAAEPAILVDTGGLVITDDGRRVLVIDRGTSALTTVRFVVAILAAVLLGFGVIAAVSWGAGRGAVFGGVGLAVGALGFWVHRKVRSQRSRPLGQCRPVAVLDRKPGLFSPADGALMPMDQVHFVRRMQITSSSPKLVAVTPGGTRTLKGGNIFDGGFGDAAEVLNAVVRDAVTR